MISAKIVARLQGAPRRATSFFCHCGESGTHHITVILRADGVLKTVQFWWCDTCRYNAGHHTLLNNIYRAQRLIVGLNRLLPGDCCCHERNQAAVQIVVEMFGPKRTITRQIRLWLCPHCRQRILGMDADQMSRWLSLLPDRLIEEKAKLSEVRRRLGIVITAPH